MGSIYYHYTSPLFGLGAAGTGTGIAALTQQNQHYSRLRGSIDVDKERLENSIHHLQESLTSLFVVVIQNRSGLDLVFLQQGGLCAALGEEWYFYTDHSRMVKKVISKER